MNSRSIGTGFNLLKIMSKAGFSPPLQQSLPNQIPLMRRVIMTLYYDVFNLNFRIRFIGDVQSNEDDILVVVPKPKARINKKRVWDDVTPKFS